MVRHARWLRPAGLVIGVLLLAAALYVAWGRRDAVREALEHLADMSPATRAALLAALLGSVLANLALTGLMFSLLMRPRGHVGLLEMQWLMAAASLLNYLPLRPGLFGRAAYHRARNGIPLTDSLKVIVQAMLISVGLSLWTALGLWVASMAGRPAMAGWCLAATLVGLGVAACLFTRHRFLLIAAAVRAFEIGVIALRYWAAFALIGHPIGASGAVAFACISVIATMAPVGGNGLGLREWAVGLAAPLLTPHAMAMGITADLLNRAAELMIIVPAGVMGLLMLSQPGWMPRSRTVNSDS